MSCSTSHPPSVPGDAATRVALLSLAALPFPWREIAPEEWRYLGDLIPLAQTVPHRCIDGKEHSGCRCVELDVERWPRTTKRPIDRDWAKMRWPGLFGNAEPEEVDFADAPSCLSFVAAMIRAHHEHVAREGKDDALRDSLATLLSDIRAVHAVAKIATLVRFGTEDTDAVATTKATKKIERRLDAGAPNRRAVLNTMNASRRATPEARNASWYAAELGNVLGVPKRDDEADVGKPVGLVRALCDYHRALREVERARRAGRKAPSPDHDELHLIIRMMLATVRTTWLVAGEAGALTLQRDDGPDGLHVSLADAMQGLRDAITEVRHA